MAKYLNKIGYSLLTFSLLSVSFAQENKSKNLVILLHGLGRTSSSMEKMALFLQQGGFLVKNIDYPSYKSSIQEISDTILFPIIQQVDSSVSIHFVTHSMGGIIVRDFLWRYPTSQVKRIVMLGPPNGGSEVADNLANIWPVSLILGEKLEQLKTDSASLVNRLPSPDVEVGIIAGNRSINWINSIMLKGPDDGKVSVERTKLPGMKDFLVLPITHTFMMVNKEVMRQTNEFLQYGRFHHKQD